MDDNLMRVRFKLNPKDKGPAGETCWALEIDNDLAEIQNIPFFADKVSLGDIVTFVRGDDPEEIPEVTGIHKKVTKKFYVRYNVGSNEETAKQHYRDIVMHMAKYKCRVEGAIPGMACVAAPLRMRNAKLEQMFEECPHLLGRDLD